MEQDQKNAVANGNGNGAKGIRVALIVSEEMIKQYSLLLHHLLAGMLDESVATALVCPPECDLETVAPLSVEVIRHPAINLPFAQLYNRRRLLEKLGDFKPTVLHSLCPKQGKITKYLAGQMDVTYILSVNSLLKRRSGLHISSKRLAKIIVPTASIGSSVSRVCPSVADRVQQINIGTFTTEAVSCFQQPNVLASMVTAYHSDNIGKFEKLLEAVRHLVIDGYEFMLVVMCSERVEKQLRKMLLQLGLSHIVVIIGLVSQWRSVLAASDIFIQMWPCDDFDPLLLEAMGTGSAIAACKGKVDDLLIDGQNSLIFDPDDELSIYGILQRLLDSRDMARKIAETAQRNIKENHTVSGMLASILDVYRQGRDR